MNLRREFGGFTPSEAVLADLARIRALWSWARGRFGGGGPFLFGARFTAADAFYLPVATRIATYRLPHGPEEAAYIDALCRVPAFRRWRAMAYATPQTNKSNEVGLPSSGAYGPGAAPLPARAVSGETPVNADCPYSGKPVAADSLAEIDGIVIGYCNPFCRDKSVADAEAWPQTAALLAAHGRGSGQAKA